MPDQFPFDRSTQHVRNFVEFGHVNLRVPDRQMALVNRDPAIGDGACAAGHEAARWRMPPG